MREVLLSALQVLEDEFAPFVAHHVTAGEVLAPRVACVIAWDRVAAIVAVVVKVSSFPLCVEYGGVIQLAACLTQVLKQELLLFAEGG